MDYSVSKSVVWESLGRVAIQDRRILLPSAGEILIRVEASGLCGTDLHIVSGEFPAAHPGVVLGHECAGTVVSVGAAVSAVKPGDRVTVDPNMPCRACFQCRAGRPHLCAQQQAFGSSRDGGLAEFMLCPVEQAYLLPSNLPTEAGSLAEPLACVVHAVDRGDVQLGAAALVIGAGPIGLMTAYLAKAAGASTVLISEKDQRRRDRASALGFECIAPENVAPQSMDVVFECAGAAPAMLAAIDGARRGGNIVWIGVVAPDQQLQLHPYELFRRELKIIGTYTNPCTMDRALALLASGQVPWEALITHRYPLNDFHRAWETHSQGVGLKVCVAP